MTTCSRLFHSVVFAGAIAIVVIAAAVIQPHSQEVASSVEVAVSTDPASAPIATPEPSQSGVQPARL